MLTNDAIEQVVRLALREDAPWGDVTSEALIPVDATATASVVAREAGVLSGVRVLRETARQVDPLIEVETRAADGGRFEAGDTVAVVRGSARSILRAERVALNLLQRLSGIATLTSEYVALTAGTSAQIVDTRKTTPGLRALERDAVVAGGGRNHRFSLSDAVLVKDNHLAVLLASGLTVTEALLTMKAKLSHTTHVEVEVDRLDQIEDVLAAGVDTIMLDNFSPADLVAGVGAVAGRALVEASGGVNLDTVAAIARSGVDLISVGALTHSVRALDLGLDISIDSRAGSSGRAPAGFAVL
ncbi:carboxylating nicotinate-nucleotide diphosphorylase [Frondihabitans sp. VKM Ac-2883]|uniref:carboxylating nicotinate-nucleotide diphosphorylase n=1 Tax=Frondihabitans sp. VKM Ac-2883 TaxID=2783823 RepID=UPI00188D44F3|nr:carboxylating nicotinate-nucleotide diphosphorylase [Frondihabitans sp. VKM Ac-2883]MBF4576198.1 carboxylating nicotinate-nucleotide diphosphorylase [Frondihabitans sp. VKM Ac-2883]